MSHVLPSAARFCGTYYPPIEIEIESHRVDGASAVDAIAVALPSSLFSRATTFAKESHASGLANLFRFRHIAAGYHVRQRQFVTDDDTDVLIRSKRSRRSRISDGKHKMTRAAYFV